MERLTCTQLSNLFGISTTLLRNLENSGIVTPKQNEQNNYRLYSYIDLERLIHWNYMRSLSFQIPEIKKMSVSKQQNDVLQIIAAHKEKVVREIALNSVRLSVLNDLEQDIQYYGGKHTVFYQCFPDTWFIPYYDRDRGILLDNASIRRLSSWIELSPIAFPLRFSTFDQGTWRFRQSGIAITKENAQRLQLSTNDARLIPNHPCLCFILQSQECDPGDLDECYGIRQANSNRIYQVLRENNLMASKMLYSKMLNILPGESMGICKMFCSLTA